MVGGVLALTVKTKFIEVVRLPSLTAIVIVVVPLAPGAGVTTTVRSAPAPLNAMFASGTNVVFEEVPETVRPPGGVSGSPMVKPMGPVGVFSFVD